MGPSPHRRSQSILVENPSQQVLAEFSQMLIESDKRFLLQLDEAAEAQKQAHLEALAQAHARHERVRNHAEVVREGYELEQLARQKRLEEEERIRVQLQQQQLGEAERQKKIAAIQQAEEQQRRVAQEAKELAEQEAQLKKTIEAREEENAKRREQIQEAERKEAERLEALKVAEAAEAAKRAQAQSVPPALTSAKPITPATSAAPATSSAPPSTNIPSSDSAKIAQSPLVSSIAEREVTHNKYLELHQKLKQFRKWMAAQAKQNLDFKKRMGDDRRAIKARVGQLTPSGEANKSKVQNIRDILANARQVTQPSVDVREFMVSPPPGVTDADAQVPALFMYLLHYFSKFIIAQFLGETNLESTVTDQIGVTACKIYSAETIMWNGIPLIDMLLAKYHMVCPILWGVYGSEKTERGRTRLGWMRTEPGGPWVNAQTHGERMIALAAGYAALYMRDFSKVRILNPFPNYHYWRTLAYILNTPAADVTETHFLVIKPLIEKYAGKFIQYYGAAAVHVMHIALIEFPKKAPHFIASQDDDVYMLDVSISMDSEL